MDADTALACARLSLGDAEQARELAGEEGRLLRAGGREALRARRCQAKSRASRPWSDVLAARPRPRRGDSRASSRPGRAEEIELYPRKERKRIETEWTERIRRARRRVETGALDLALQVVSLWYADLRVPGVGGRRAGSQLDRLEELRADSGADPARAARRDRAGGGHSRCDFRSTYPRSLRAKRSRIAWNDCWRCETDAPLVYLRPPAEPDREEFISLMRASRSFHRPWATAPTDDERFDAYLADSRRPDFEALLVCRQRGHGDHRFLQPLPDRARLAAERLPRLRRRQAYAGKGYMREGIRLVLRHAFLTMRLHRIEANIQPGNHASIALARGAGFQREGFSPRYLKIGGRWRDHERWALLAEDWRSRADVREMLQGAS